MHYLALEAIALLGATVAPTALAAYSVPRTQPSDPSQHVSALPWPNQQVTYCFADQNAADTLGSYWDAAWKIWGDIPVRQNPQIPGPSRPICTGSTRNVLVVSCNSNGVLATTCGFQDGIAHSMTIDCKVAAGTGDVDANVAHELGHALGLDHEHQRPGSNVNIDCQNLRDYQDMVNKYTKDVVDNLLCSNQQAATRNGFVTAANLLPYLPTPARIDDGGSIDYASIMIYGSNFGGKQPLPVAGQRFGPRAKVMKRADGSTWSGNKKPSQRDLDRVKFLYQ